MTAQLVYDVGMNNGDDTAYYLRCGFRVVAIDANPVMVEEASRRFQSEIAEGLLTILNIGVSDREGTFPFWVCDGHPEWSSFDESIASREGVKHHQIRIPCRRFHSVLTEFGTPHYLKLDIEGHEIYCLRDLIVPDLPKYVSFEKTAQWTEESLQLLNKLGYTGFKLISQTNFLPLQYPPVPVQIAYEHALNFLQSRNLFARIARKTGAGRSDGRVIEEARTCRGWEFPPGSSGPFGEDLHGDWQSFERMKQALAKANASWQAKEASVFWGDKDYSFWADFHAKRGD